MYLPPQHFIVDAQSIFILTPSPGVGIIGLKNKSNFSGEAKMEEKITKEAYLRFLSIAPTNVLEQAGIELITTAENLPEDSQDSEIIGVMLAMLGREHELRQVEPLWRKAKRFAIRNSQTFKQVGKVAACIGAGVILGEFLDN